MKKNMLKMAFVALGMMVCGNANAQLENILKSVAGEAAANVVGNLLGTSKVSEKSMVGTWSYNQPCVAFESENVLATVGSSMVSTKVEKTMQNGLTKVGFTSGKVVMTFKEDKTGIIKYNGKAVDVNWAVDGANLKLSFPLLNKGVTMNAKMSGSELQLAMKSDKLLCHPRISLMRKVTI